MLQAVLSSRSQKEAASAAGISETTLWRYLKEESFAKRLREARLAATGHSMMRLQQLSGDAVAMLHGLTLKEDAPAAARDREFYRLTYPFTMEDEFTDPRAHAAALWQAYRLWSEEEEGASATRQRGAERKVKNDPRVRTLNALRAQY